MPREEAPNIHAGQQLTYTKSPFLGKSRIGIVIAVINAFLRMRITRGNSDKFTISARGAILQIKDSETGSSAATGFFPFKIYQVNPESSDDWRKVRVRAGRINSKVLTGSGCDGYDTNPDEYIFPDCDDIEVPANESEYYLWIELDGTEYVLNHGDPPEGWSNYPDPHKSYWPIGFVDTASRASDQVAVIRQLQRQDFMGLETPICDPLTNESSTVVTPAILVEEEEEEE